MRGFSFLHDGPLAMRYDQPQGIAVFLGFHSLEIKHVKKGVKALYENSKETHVKGKILI